jgi:hypothetical protein
MLSPSGAGGGVKIDESTPVSANAKLSLVILY